MPRRKSWFLNYVSESTKEVGVYFSEKSDVRPVRQPGKKQPRGSILSMEIPSIENMKTAGTISVKFNDQSGRYIFQLENFDFRLSPLSEQFLTKHVIAKDFCRHFQTLVSDGIVAIPCTSGSSKETTAYLDTSASSAMSSGVLSTSISFIDDAEPPETRCHFDSFSTVMSAPTPSKRQKGSDCSSNSLKNAAQASFIGPFELPLKTLNVGDQLYRALDPIRVQILVDDFTQQYNICYQPVCVMVEGVKKTSFNAQLAHTYTYKVLGGQHNVAACKSILSMQLNEQHLEKLDTRLCMVYEASNDAVQLFLSKEHQRVQENVLTYTFQDKVRLANQIKKSPQAANDDGCWRRRCERFMIHTPSYQELPILITRIGRIAQRLINSCIGAQKTGFSLLVFVDESIATPILLELRNFCKETCMLYLGVGRNCASHSYGLLPYYSTTLVGIAGFYGTRVDKVKQRINFVSVPSLKIAWMHVVNDFTRSKDTVLCYFDEDTAFAVACIAADRHVLIVSNAGTLDIARKQLQDYVRQKEESSVEEPSGSDTAAYVSYDFDEDTTL